MNGTQKSNLAMPWILTPLKLLQMEKTTNGKPSKCSSIPPVYHLIQQTDPSQPTKLMILGTACSIASIIMGEIAERRLNITQVSYAATSPLFGNQEKYPRFYRMVTEVTQYFDGYDAILRKFNWKKVAVVYYDDDFTLNVGNNVVRHLNNSEFEIILNLIFADGTEDYVIQQIKSVNARIVILVVPPSPLNVLVNFWCRAIKSRITGPNFVWLLPGWFLPDWWNVTDSDCDAEEMRDALEHSLVFVDNGKLINDASRMLVSNKNVSQFKEDLQNKTTIYGVDTDVDVGSRVGYIYDAVWTIALALNSSISILEDRGLGRLENFTYDSVEMANVFTEAVANVSFQGISGNVSFEDGNATRPASLLIFQYQNGVPEPILIFSLLQTNDSEKLQFVSNSSFIWQGGDVPRDSPIPIVRESNLVEFIIAGVVSSIGILSTVFFFVFNLYYRKHPVVRKSSYRLNSLILVAVFVGFVGTLLHVIKLDDDMSEVVTTTICNARNWTNKLAFVVAFGTLFVKIWRLYRIFLNRALINRKHLDDKYLLLIVAVIVAPILVVLIVQVATFPLKLHRHEIINEDDLMTVEIYKDCSGDHGFIFLGVCYIEYVLLALFSILVAYQTQKNIGVYRKHLESAVINLTTILAVLLSSICQVVVIILHLNDQQEGVLLVITLRDCLWMFPMIYLLFIPKVYRVKKMPQFINKVNESVANTFWSRKSVELPDFDFHRRSSDAIATHNEKTQETSLNSISNLYPETKVTFSTVFENHSAPYGIDQNTLNVPYHLCDTDTLNGVQLQ
ncbi:gamma-aminobutyric acid type B receptor subunit 2-like isoform X2 [Dysidea avara]|uniref:gamma-aminobutyric acid type B receptor subunit 2-like isoform X2 n=1 Tax=Dysidea avara TaxID=196820 RepID=UPI00331E4BC9